MELAHQFTFLGAALVMLSILVGLLSARIGAPLLLVFLGLGMLAGENGPGGIQFNDFQLTYLVGSIALAIVLFDGGLRTPTAAFRLALAPALLLATIGVVVTATIAGAMAVWLGGFDWIGGLLVGAIVGSTDAAAVFLLLHLRGMELQRRVSATLEVEAGANDPMAIFLTIALVELATRESAQPWLDFGLRFLVQMGGGAAIGIVGGFALLWLINRVVLAAGLYPILAAAGALVIFSGAQEVHASGFLAVYLAGLIIGNHRHRANLLISRFHDGLAWLAQIVMFLVLGLLVTPSALLPDLLASLGIVAVLILVARPVAVWLCLIPFRFTWQEQAFIAWVGLRGAVPIFLACIPVLAGYPGGDRLFNAAFVVVLVSMLVQGWTVGQAARLLGLELPPRPEPVERGEIEMPATADREAASWRVAPGSPALDHSFAELAMPRRTRIIAVIRDGTVQNRAALDRLQINDHVIALAPPEHMITLDKQFAPRTMPRDLWMLGEFIFDAHGTTLAALADMYDLPVDAADRDLSLAVYMLRDLGRAVVVGDRAPLGPVELVVAEMDRNGIAKVGLDLTPQRDTLPIIRLWNGVRRLWHRRMPPPNGDG